MDEASRRRLARRFGASDARRRRFAGRAGTEFAFPGGDEFWIADGLPAEIVLEFIEDVLREERRAAFGDRRDDLRRIGDIVGGAPIRPPAAGS